MIEREDDNNNVIFTIFPCDNLAELTKEIDDCLNVASELLSLQTSNMSKSSLLVTNIYALIFIYLESFKKYLQFFFF